MVTLCYVLANAVAMLEPIKPDPPVINTFIFTHPVAIWEHLLNGKSFVFSIL